MKINFSDMIFSLSNALGYVEAELIGSKNYHCQRVGYLSVMLGKELQLDTSTLIDLAAYAVLHDNALTEYIAEELNYNQKIAENSSLNLASHCIAGEQNIELLPIDHTVNGAILYHHENADGSGAFGRKAKDTPLNAQIIHLADQIDVAISFNSITEYKRDEILYYLKENTGTLFTNELSTAFINTLQKINVTDLTDQNVKDSLIKIIPTEEREYNFTQIKSIAKFFAKIIDYKSNSTKNHSLGVADKCYKMADYYKYDLETKNSLYIAGALHDIGKLAVDTDVLEKPDKLTQSEYTHIQTHVYYTYEILSKIKGFEQITKWAAYHHEKLDGSGYPFGKTADELDFNQRLMACIDIYQALTEKRVYKEGMPHKNAINILYEMASNGKLDNDIVKDLDCVYSV